MINLFSDRSLVDSNTLIQILDDTISSRIKKLGLVRKSNYLWYLPSIDTIRPGIEYTILKGGQGTFSWGVCIGFIPTITGSKLTFFRTEKKFKLHLFEWTDEYSNSFFGGQIQRGVTIHWGLSETQKSIKELIDRYENKIIAWFDKAKTIEGLLDLLEHQVNLGRQYNFHSPDPKYILAFLYAKLNQAEKAIELFDNLTLLEFNNNEELRLKARVKLLQLID